MDIAKLLKTHITATAAAREIGVSRVAIFDRIARGTLASVRVGKSVYVLRSLVAAAKRQKNKPKKSGNNSGLST